MATKAKKAAAPKDTPPPAPAKLAALPPPPKGDFSVTTDITLHRLESATQSLAHVLPNILQLEAAANRAVVDSEAAFNKGSTFLSACDGQLVQVEALRKAIYQPVWDYAKLIQATFKPYSDRLTAARQKVRDLMTSYYNAEEKRKRDEAAAAQRAIDEEAQALAIRHAAAGDQEDRKSTRLNSSHLGISY